MTDIKGEHGYKSWTKDKLMRKANQHWEMAGLARRDNDQPDVERNTALAELYEAEARR